MYTRIHISTCTHTHTYLYDHMQTYTHISIRSHANIHSRKFIWVYRLCFFSLFQSFSNKCTFIHFSLYWYSLIAFLFRSLILLTFSWNNLFSFILFLFFSLPFSNFLFLVEQFFSLSRFTQQLSHFFLSHSSSFFYFSLSCPLLSFFSFKGSQGNKEAKGSSHAFAFLTHAVTPIFNFKLKENDPELIGSWLFIQRSSKLSNKMEKRSFLISIAVTNSLIGIN